ncbi:hypothetical protein [Diaphorobacter sp. MNS-0]|uniref:hypothetical protein n=1 Tax=Diaphorobacter sp. MNS-0 TaxID=2866628 RepID=UPI001C73CD60|nr:hypothetical protein [Diaphorobacter sp. MNS-0]QYY27496.1 hypothetical protein K2L43_18730 [Diaphorobacter sp. MNS-0]
MLFLNRIPDHAMRPALLGTLAVSGGIVAYASHTSNPLLLFPALLVFGLFYGLILENDWRKFRDRRHRAVIGTFKQLDQIADGKRWIGAQSTIVAQLEPSDMEGVPRPYHRMTFRYPLLCKTEKGAWFLLHVLTHGDKVIEYGITPIAEEKAAELVQDEPEIMARHFKPLNAVEVA